MSWGCPFYGGPNTLLAGILGIGVKIFFLIWIVFVPTMVISRLEKIIKLLQEKK